jgi:GH15 family glucan-1,4-alpha-glucosidase
LQKTQSRIESKLLDQSPAGGSPRYEHDRYFEADSNYQGNPWFVTTLWLAQLYARNKNTSRARHYIDWTIRHALPSGVLPEQIHPVNGSPLSVAPLIWSHAELINTMLDLNNTK